MKKRLITAFLAAVLLLGTLAVSAAAATNPTEETVPGGSFGDGFTWRLEGGTLTITGEGPMEAEAPWKEYKDSIKKVVFTGGVTTVGEAVFRGYESIREIDFGEDMVEIGVRAFQNCTGLTQLHMPESFRRFCDACFEGCTSLGKIYFDGYMPNFRSNCLWNGGKMNLYYSTERVWGIEYILELETNFGGRLEVLCEDGTDPLEYRPGDGQYTVPTEPEEEETEPPTTEAATVATTAPETEPTETTQATVPETTAPAATEAVETEIPTTREPFTFETEAPAGTQEPQRESSSYIGLILIAGVVAFFLVGGVLFSTRRGGGKYGR